MNRESSQTTPQPLLSLFSYLFSRCMACEIIVLQPKSKPMAPALAAQSLNYWTTKEIPTSVIFNMLKPREAGNPQPWERQAVRDTCVWRPPHLSLWLGFAELPRPFHLTRSPTQSRPTGQAQELPTKAGTLEGQSPFVIPHTSDSAVAQDRHR